MILAFHEVMILSVVKGGKHNWAEEIWLRLVEAPLFEDMSRTHVFDLVNKLKKRRLLVSCDLPPTGLAGQKRKGVKLSLLGEEVLRLALEALDDLGVCR